MNIVTLYILFLMNSWLHAVGNFYLNQVYQVYSVRIPVGNHTLLLKLKSSKQNLRNCTGSRIERIRVLFTFVFGGRY